MVAVLAAESSFDRFFSCFVPGYPVVGSKQRPAERKRLINIVFSFFFQRIDSRTMIRQIDRWEKFDQSEEFRTNLNLNGYFLKNVKVFLYYWIARDQRFMHWLESRADYPLTRWIDQDLIDWIKTTFVDKGYPCLTLERLEFRIAQVMELTATKLHLNIKHQYRWVLTSQSLEDKDIIGELRIRGLQAIMRVYPEIRKVDDAVRIVGKSMKNYGMNLYSYYSSPARQAILQVGHKPREFSAPPCTVVAAGGQAKVITESEAYQMRLDAIRKKIPQGDKPRDKWEQQTEHIARNQAEGDKSWDVFGARMDSQALEFLVEETSEFNEADARHDVQCIKAAVAGCPCKIEFLQLLTGEYHEGFTLYLRMNGVIGAGEANDDWQAKTSVTVAQQARHASIYLGREPELGQSLLDELREKFSPATSPRPALPLH